MKRKKKQRGVKEEQIPFKCLKCGITEDIPREAVEFFHEMDGGDISVPPRFQCEESGGIMEPIHYTTDDGVTYSLED